MDQPLSNPFISHYQHFLAFLYQQDPPNVEGKEGEEYVVQFEAVDCWWFYQAMMKLSMGRLAQELHDRLGDEDIGSVYEGLSFELQEKLYRTHRQYLMLMTDSRDPAPVYLLSGRFSVNDRENFRFTEGRWYEISVPGRTFPDPLRPFQNDGQMSVSEIATHIDNDPLTWFAENVSIDPIGPNLQALLQALHVPQSMPREAGNTPTQGQAGDGSPAGDQNSHLEFSTTEHTKPGSEGASGERPPEPASVACNPMIYQPERYQPFVGVNWVGAGNNISLYGTDGAVCAHVDFGCPTNVNGESYDDKNDPCLCDDAPIILSHWDYDHYAMVRKRPEALRRRWLAPQQGFGAVAAREIYARRLNEMPNGAELAIWPASAKGGHFATDFGYIERATGRPSNDDCLVVFVRVKDKSAPALAAAPLYGKRTRPANIKSTEAGLIAKGPLVLNSGKAGAILPADLKEAKLRGLVLIEKAAHEKLRELNKPGEDVIGRFKLENGSAYWIDEKGTSSTGEDLSKYVSVIGTAAWTGGWAIQPKDFVALGGVMIDFPPPGRLNKTLVCVSPTPGNKEWDPKIATAPAGATLISTTGKWTPVWGDGKCFAASLTDPNVIGVLPFGMGPSTLIVSKNTASTSPEEHYVLLPGDAGFQYMPSLAKAPAPAAPVGPPTIVGLMATHHGARSWFEGKDKDEKIGYIPNAPAGIPAKIVYSYGTVLSGSDAGNHYFAAKSGGDGHPHGEAIDAYRAKGWGGALDEPGVTSRLNTATRDFDSAQKFNPLKLKKGTPRKTANKKGHSNGNVALGWDLDYNLPLVEDRLPTGVNGANINGQKGPQPIMRTCKDCGKIRYYYFSNPQPPKADTAPEIGA